MIASDAPRELVHRWGRHQLRWPLEPVAGGTRLTLEHTFDGWVERGSFAAGWHICLAVLAAAADGHDVERAVGPRAADYGWSALRDRYDATMQ